MSLELNTIRLAIRLSEGEHILLDNFSLTVASGEIVSIMGPSGCGKSTLLAYLCGALAPETASGSSSEINASGTISIDGCDVTNMAMEKRKIGLLFQDDLLFPHMNVEENLAFALPYRLSKNERHHRISEALAAAGLSGYKKSDPRRLSGGQRARISLMRTLLAEPRALLLDEPFSKLDSRLRTQIRDFVFTTIRERNIPALMVTHDRQDCSERIIELHRSEAGETTYD